MLDEKTKEGIMRFIKHVRRMNTLSDDQLRFLITTKISENPDHYHSIGIDIEGYIQWLRQVGMTSDDQIKKRFKDEIEINKDTVYHEIFEDADKKRSIIDMEKAARDMKSDPRSFARSVA